MQLFAAVTLLLAASATPMATASSGPDQVAPLPTLPPLMPEVLDDAALQAQVKRWDALIDAGSEQGRGSLMAAWTAGAAARNQPVGGPAWSVQQAAVARSMADEEQQFLTLARERSFLQRAIRTASPADRTLLEQRLDMNWSQALGCRERVLSNLRVLAHLPQGMPPSP